MKILDASAIIAFLSEMNCPESLSKLAKYHRLLIPEGVYNEIKKPPGKHTLDRLVKEAAIKIVKPNPVDVIAIQNEHPQLHLGECEVIAFVLSYSGSEKIYILSDDLMARKKYPQFDFGWTEQLLDIMKERKWIESIIHKEKMKLLSQSPFYTRRFNS